MPTKLKDPKSSSRWGGWGAVGRWGPGGFGTGSEPQAPLPPLPQPPDFGDANTKPYGGFGDYAKPIEDRAADDYLKERMSRVDGWSHVQPPINDQGQPLDPYGKPLPERAQGFDAYGEAVYGDGLQGYWAKVQDSWGAPVTKADEKLQGVEWDSEWRNPLEAVGNVWDIVAGGWNNFWYAGKQDGEKAGALALTGRAVEIGAEGVLDAFDWAGKKYEWVAGSTNLALRETAEGSPLPEMPEVRFPEWTPEWMQELEGLGAGNPLLATYNVIRTFAKPGDTWDEYKQIVETIYEKGQTGEGNIAYSAWKNPAVTAEYQRRYQQGVNPKIIATELENPITEMVGQILWDPLNVVEFVTGAVVGKITKARVAAEFLDIADDINDVMRVTDIGDGAQVAHLTELAQAQHRVSRATAEGLTDLADSRGFLNLTTDGKRYKTNKRVSAILEFVGANADTPDDAIETLRAMALAHSDDLDEVAEGVAIMNRFPAPKALYGKAGQETGIMLHDMMSYGGKLDPGRFIDELVEVREAEGLRGVIDFARKNLDPIIEQKFPTLIEAAKRGDDIPGWAQGIARFDEVAKGRIYGPVNNVLSGVYMGLNPGFAARNYITNTVHILFDHGTKAYGSGTMWNPKAWAGIAEEYIGYVPEAMIEGMGKANIAGEVATDQLWWAPVLKYSEDMEVKAAHRVVGASIKDTMTKGLRPGKAIPHVDELLQAGLSKDAAHLLISEVVNAKGWVDNAVKSWRQKVKTGTIEIRRTMGWLDDDMAVRAQKAGYYDELVQAANAESTADANRIIDDILEDWKRQASGGTDEAITVPHESEIFEERVINADLHDLMPSADKATQGRDWQIQANTLAIRAGQEVVNKELAPILGQIRYAAQQAGDTDLLAKAEEIWRRYGRDLSWGSEEMGLYDDIMLRSRNYMQQSMDQYRALRDKRGLDWAAEWEKIMPEIPRPDQVSRGEFMEAYWVQRTYPRQAEMWQAFLDIYTRAIHNAGDEIMALGGEIDKTSPLWQNFATKSFEALDIKDFAFMHKGGGDWQRLSVNLRSAIDRGDQASAVRILAHKYDIASMSSKGKYNDKWIDNALKKYGDNPDFTIGKRGGTMPTLEEAWRAFEGRRRFKMESAGHTYVPLFDNPDDLILAAQPFRTNREIPDAVKHMFESVSDTDIGLVEDAILWFYDQLDEIPDNLQSLVSDWEEQVRHLSDSAVSGASVSQRRQARDLEPVLRQQIKDRVYKWLDDQGWLEDLPEEAKKLSPPYDPAAMPTPRVVAKEQVRGLDSELRTIKKRLNEVWNETGPAKLDEGIEAALEGWSSTAKTRTAELRLLAEQVGAEARKFALHNYPEKSNFDLALAYIYPYQFWYSRTYKNWLRRLVANPAKIQAYADYREGLEKIHAGAPDFWKYSVNTNELLGLDSDNPLFFNLEATLNPLNGLTGVDFNDPQRRVNWWTSLLDGLNKFGPSIWTPLAFAAAVGLSWKGEEEAAARWGNRLIPQTATLKSIAALAFDKNVELDPAVWLFSKGTDPYERRRVGRALGAMVETGDVTAEQAMDAGWNQGGDIWDQARLLATKRRGWGQLFSAFLGVGFKARSPEDMQIDQMYQDYYGLWNQRGLMSNDEFRQSMESLRVTYPFMDTVLLSRRGGPARDTFMAYNVLSRIPPGSSGDFTKLAGIDKRLVSKFYDSKGDMSQWNATERERFMAGITDLSVILALPSDGTKAEWSEARRRYGAMQDLAKQQFGEDIWNMVDAYFATKGDTIQSQEAARRLLEANPLIGQAMDWKREMVFNDPYLQAYYGGIEQVESYYNGLYRTEVIQLFGEDIYNVQQEYFNLKEIDPVRARAYLDEHPELKEKWDMGREWDTAIAERLQELEGTLPLPQGAAIRPDFGQPTIYQQDIQQEIQGQSYAPQGVTWDQWQSTLTRQETGLLIDYFRGDDLPLAMRERLEAYAEQFGMPPDEMLKQMQSAYFLSGGQ